jgi:predicted Ser/Thr protein kinase
MLPLTPTKLGRYEILDEIGKGAMGVVYLAKDPLIGRLVALKTFRVGLSVQDREVEQFRARFIREAQSAGILSHPNIVTIHDVVEDAGGGLSFIAMEYVHGTNLKHLLQSDHPLPLPRVAEIVSQVADALDYAHSQRVIHRDVKPANIIITDGNRVKITDFGIARLDTSNLTQEGQLLGTPNYMAPEQVQGKEVDHRADLFALGVVLYEMLTRHKPFQGENLTVVSHRIVYDQFTPPRDFATNLPPGVEKLLTRALEKDPNRRYQRARDLADDLAKVVEESVAGEDLNETQSLSATMALPPAPPPSAAPARRKRSLLGNLRERLGLGPRLQAPPQAAALAAVPPPSPVDGTGSGTAGSRPRRPAEATTASPGAAAAVAPAVAVARRTQPRRSSLRRLVAVGGAAAAVAILLGAVALLWAAWAPGGEIAAGPPPELLPLILKGHEQMRSGEFVEAAATYREAQRLAPDFPVLTKLQFEAEQLARDLEKQVGVEQDIIAQLVAGQRALEERRFADAAAAAQVVLALQPGHPDAFALQAKAKEAEARARQRPEQPQSAQRAGPESSIETAATPEHASTPEATAAVQTASLHIDFDSDSPKGGTVVVYREGKGIWSTAFAGTRRGLFGRKPANPDPIVETVPVSAGDGVFHVVVTPRGEGAKTADATGRLTAGGDHGLQIRLLESKELTAKFLD